METARRGCAIPVLLAVIFQLLTACAGGKENSRASIGLARDDSSKGDVAAAVKAKKENLPDQTTSEKRCLKEGEPCSTLNDECCPGYRCPMGLDPKCIRNP